VPVGPEPTGEVKVWDARTGAELLTLRGHTDWVIAVAYSPDGTRLASASHDQTVKVWDVTSGAELLTLRGHSGALTAVAYSPDGTRLATASSDKTVKVWDATSGAETATLRGHTDAVMAVAYSPDGTRLAAASYNGTVKVWDARIGPGGYDPWAEDLYRRTALAPAWHAHDARDAERRGDWFAAAFHRRRLAQLRPDEPEHRLDLARALWQRGRWREALEACDGVIAHHRGLAPAYLDHARLRRSCGDHLGADRDGLAALALAATSRTGWSAFAQREAEAGAAAAGRGDWAQARQHLGLAVLWQPAEAEHLRRLAWAQLAGGDTTACRRTLRRLHQVCRDVPQEPRESARHAAATVVAAALLPESGIDVRELESLARRAVEADPPSWRYREVLGAALLRAGQPDEAVRELGRGRAAARGARLAVDEPVPGPGTPAPGTRRQGAAAPPAGTGYRRLLGGGAGPAATGGRAGRCPAARRQLSRRAVLPGDERDACRKLWADVAALLQKATPP
jgi:tetratricopeptide (TPR) repeat protein